MYISLLLLNRLHLFTSFKKAYQQTTQLKASPVSHRKQLLRVRSTVFIVDLSGHKHIIKSIQLLYLNVSLIPHSFTAWPLIRPRVLLNLPYSLLLFLELSNQSFVFVRL